MASATAVKKRIYSNCKLLHPDGTVMCRCAKKRAQWYLDRNLAEYLGEDKKGNSIFRLTFTPKGCGKSGDPFYLQDRESKCCVCGCEDDLSKHHIVPLYFRRYLNGSENSSHDVLPMCRRCHDVYERQHAARLRKDICDNYGVHEHGMVAGMSMQEYQQISRAANTLLKYRERLPDLKEIRLELILLEHLDAEATIADLEDLSRRPQDRDDYISGGELVAAQVKDVDEFYKMWRYHFLHTMKPKFMPKHWDPDRPVPS